MRQFTHHITQQTTGRGLHDITEQVGRWVKGTGITTGLLTIYIRHTSASLLINENYDSDVIADLERFFARLVRDGDPLFEHTIEGPDDMPAHVRTALTQTHLSIPLLNNKLALGTWQGIFLYEHRRASAERQVVLHMIGE